VKGFAPWGWIVGTGIYVEDVRQDIAAVTQRLAWVSAAILIVILGLSGYIIRQGFGFEKSRRTAEQALRSSERQYRLLAETAREFILVFDRTGAIRYANKAWRRRGGYAEADLPKMALADIVAPKARARLLAQVSDLINGDRGEVSVETAFVAGDNKPISVEVTVVPMAKAPPCSRYLLTARDVSEKKEMAALARRQQEQLFQASKMVSLGTLVSGVAHEINNPVMSIMLNAPILKKVWRAVEPILDDHCRRRGDIAIGAMTYGGMRRRVPQVLNGILDSTRRIKTIVGDLKDFARQQPTALNGTVNVNDCVQRAVGLTDNLVKKSTNRFQVACTEGLPAVKGNRQRIEQVVINLLLNACQAAADPDLPIEVATGRTGAKGTIFVQVRDRGVGMSAETLERITDPFFTTRREAGGTGLGLAICDRIARDHGGSLSFRSRPGAGTIARLTLPVTGPVETPRGEKR
jgi:PAS domain S-box-containing protein